MQSRWSSWTTPYMIVFAIAASGLCDASAQPYGWEIPAQVILGYTPQQNSASSTPVCEVCDFTIPAMQLQWMDEDMATAVATAMSDWNLDLIYETDARLQAGEFGDPSSDAACQEARRYLKFHALSAMDFIGYLGTQQATLWETDETQITPFFSRFVNPGMYPIWGLERCLLGGGAFCMEFDVEGTPGGKRMMGGRKVKLASTEVDNATGVIPAWDIEMPIAGGETARFLFCQRYSGKIRTEVVSYQGRDVMVLVLEDLDGFFIRKKGTHECGAIIVWRSVLEDDTWPPPEPCLGAAAYFPSLKLDLPWFLPDVSLDDLRGFSAFQPIFSLAACQSQEFPEWVGMSPDGVLEDWDSEGDMPPVLRDWFPDL